MPGKGREGRGAATRAPVQKYREGREMGGAASKDPCTAETTTTVRTTAIVGRGEPISIREARGQAVVMSSTGQLGRLTGSTATAALQCLRKGVVLTGVVSKVEGAKLITVTFAGA